MDSVDNCIENTSQSIIIRDLFMYVAIFRPWVLKKMEILKVLSVFSLISMSSSVSNIFAVSFFISTI